MKNTLRFLCATFAISASQALVIAPDDAGAILRHVDAVRNPLVNFSLDLELTTYRKDQPEVWRLRVYGKGNDRSLVEFLSPASEKGKYLLMLRDGMWIYVPNTSRPIRISPLQRLMGDASNGDVARTNYSIDYVAESVAARELDGRPAYLLDLKAKDADLSYGRVQLWVARPDHTPIQADYYVGSGKLMKRVFFREFAAGMVSKVEIQDAVRTDRRTVMVYSHLQAKELPEKMFQPGYLGKW